jgi:predicted nucleic acid-binding protein
MASEIFVDTSGFYACLVARDDGHEEAAAVLVRARGRRCFVTTDYVLDEVATLLRARRLGHLVEPVFRLTVASPACQIEWMDPVRFGSARAYLGRHGADHGYSFTDCFSFCTMERLGLREALTKDEHFRQAGFSPLLAP